VTRSSLPSFPDWVPEAVQLKAIELWNNLPTEEDPGKAQALLQNLTTDPIMKGVWKRAIYARQKNCSGSSNQYKYPGCVSPASIARRLRTTASKLRKKELFSKEAHALEFEASLTEQMADCSGDPNLPEQDRAAQLFLWHIYRAALHLRPIMRSDYQATCDKLRIVAHQLRNHASEVRLLSLETEAAQLEAVASSCDSEAALKDPSKFDDDPGIIKRKSGDMQLRTLVVSLSYTCMLLFGNHLYGTVAKIATLILGKGVAHEKVREMLRGP
jgi:hypothetical protein